MNIILRSAAVACAALLVRGAIAPVLAEDMLPCTAAKVAGGLRPECLEDVGYAVCIHRPGRVPGLYDMPQWPAKAAQTCTQPSQCTGYDAANPNFDCLSGWCVSKSSVRSEVSDPRWGNDPLKGLQVSPVFTSSNDQVRYRMLVDDEADPKEIAVSIQIQATTGPADSDFVYFGLADAAGTARGLRISLAGARGQHVPVSGDSVAYYEYGGPGGSWTGGTDVPSWVKSGISVWNSQEAASLNGAAVAVQFKLDLQRLAFLKKSPGYLMLGTEMLLGNEPVFYFTPNLDQCGDRGEASGRAACIMGNDVLSLPNNPFLADPRQWTPVTSIGSACTGINVLRSGISTALRCGPNNEYTNCVTTLKGLDNTFSVVPEVPSTSSVTAGDITAVFKMSNWGSVAHPAQWIPLKEGTNGSPAQSYRASAYCPANASDGLICGKAITSGPTESFHQCLQVELRPSQLAAGKKIDFANAAAYTNTRFKSASVIDLPAEINVRGLLDKVPAAATRDVYLHVVTYNMKTAGSTKTALNTSSLFALRGQADAGFAGAGSCTDKSDVCIPGDGTGTCSYRVDYPYGYSGCKDGESDVWMWGTYFCKRSESCTVPAGGGVNPYSSSLDPTQKLEAEFPTLKVFPYYDSGETAIVKGIQRKRLIPMPSFTVHAWHEGDFYGWLHALVDSAGNRLLEVYPNVYKLAVDKSKGVGAIRVMMSAEEKPHYAGLSNLVGDVTTLNLGLGTVGLAGVMTSSQELDLSKTSLVIDKLLNENGRELVTNLKGPVTLKRLPGALPYAAAYKSSAGPHISVQITKLPLIGQIVTIQVAGANVSRPSACGWFGTAALTTAFSVTDGASPPVQIGGTDQWSCPLCQCA